MIEPQQAQDIFGRQFDARADVVVTSPGRVNLIGEHVDYNDGLVMPMAIDRGTTLAARRNGTSTVRLWADRFAQADCFSLDDLAAPGEHAWSNYVRGVVSLLAADGVEVCGADVVIASDLPVGGGLSSSASLEVGTAMTFLELAGATMAPLAIARLCQRAEHQFAGVPCGLMDQYAVVFGQEGMAVAMDCRTNTHNLVPADHPSLGWMILDSNAPRTLAGSGYAQRRAECDKALAVLRKLHGVKSLRDATLEMVESSERKLGKAPTRRARHVVTEIQRVREAADYLRLARYDLVGRLMYHSHLSLADDFEVTIPELDHVVKVARDTLGVYGCRMTGGGFGGCLIALTAVEAQAFFAERVGRSYQARFGRELSILTTAPADGARVHRIP